PPSSPMETRRIVVGTALLSGTALAESRDPQRREGSMNKTRNQQRGTLLLGVAGLALLTPAPLAAQLVTTLKGHTAGIGSVAFSPDGKRIVSGSDDETVKVWDAQTGQETLTLKGHTHWVISVAFSPDGKRIASGSFDKTVRVWDAHTGQKQ